jgi:O-antigen/teichoic acid export membrane protein
MKNKDSVAKGSGSVVISRLLGMVLSFALFIALARHSDIEAGIFRTVFTYFIIAESLGMLGMHRWLVTEVAPDNASRWKIFLSMTSVSLAASAVLSVIYLGIAYSGFYDADLSLGLKLAALAVIPSGLFQCVQSTLLGVGKSYLLGTYNFFEYFIRCTVSMILIYLDFHVTTIIIVFVVTRWIVALYGFRMIKQMLGATTFYFRRSDVVHVLKDAPRFILIIFSFLAIRSTAMVLLPAFSDEAEAAVYAAAYQLFDMILIIPSVLALTSNNLFVNKANLSDAALRRVTTQLTYLTSSLMFPCIAIVILLSSNVVFLLYGERFGASSTVLVVLMVVSGVTMVDQVLSQVMITRKDYKNDMISVFIGGMCVLITTLISVGILKLGAFGASIALLVSLCITVIVRIYILRLLFAPKLLLRSIWRSLVASFIVYIIFKFILIFSPLTIPKYSIIYIVILTPIAISFYLVFLYFLGGISDSKLRRAKNFLFNS